MTSGRDQKELTGVSLLAIKLSILRTMLLKYWKLLLINIPAMIIL